MKEKIVSYYRAIHSLIIILCFLFLFSKCGDVIANDQVVYTFTGYQMIFGNVVDDYKVLNVNVVGIIFLITP